MRSKLITAAQLPGYLKFRSALRNPEAAQLRRLKEILSSLQGTSAFNRLGLSTDMSYKEFHQRVPLSDYSNWEGDIQAQREGNGNSICAETQRYQPTSGSTSSQKWIPYSRCFMNELDAAVEPWLGDIGLRHPQAFRGSQYWSLSWLPEDQRQDRPSNDDAELMPAWKRHFFHKIKAVSSNVTHTSTMEESQFATLASLCARSDLSLVSVWSPTFWLTLLEKLTRWQELLAETLDSGKWALPDFQSKLRAPARAQAAAQILRTFHGPELYQKLWPKLALISCWDSASSELWANKIRALHPAVQVQGKGLWATEGVVTIPFQKTFPAALTSHFLEWIDLQTDQTYPTWKLRPGQLVQPVLSGGHGLLRYKLNDSLLVTGKLENTPTFEFRGRLHETDLVGEKLSPQLALETFKQVEKNIGADLMSMLAIRTVDSKPYYLVLARDNQIKTELIETALEESLSRVFHYRLARELGQLGAARVRIEKKPESVYRQIFERKGMLAGDIKVEPLAEVSETFL